MINATAMEQSRCVTKASVVEYTFLETLACLLSIPAVDYSWDSLDGAGIIDKFV